VAAPHTPSTANHTPYTDYDFDRHGVFKPLSTSAYAAKEAKINNYDNFIIATDDFISNVLGVLKERSSVYIIYCRSWRFFRRRWALGSKRKHYECSSANSKCQNKDLSPPTPGFYQSFFVSVWCTNALSKRTQTFSSDFSSRAASFSLMC
jgi:hypothetical protein